jgi:hypothetical protein
MASITLDFSKIPGDVALFLSQNEHVEELARQLSRCMGLPEPEQQLIHQELVGAVAEVIDGHLDYATKPRS